MIAVPMRATVACLLLLSCGCAAFRDGKLAPTENWPPKVAATSAAKRRAINVDLAGNVIGGLKATWTGQAVRAMRDSGLFSNVTATTRTDAPLRASVRVTYEKKIDQGMLSVAGFTLFLVPVSVGRASFTVETTFYVNGALQGTIRRTEGCSVWAHLFLVFAAPFASESAIYYDCFKSTVVEAYQRKWFGSPPIG